MKHYLMPLLLFVFLLSPTFAEIIEEITGEAMPETVRLEEGNPEMLCMGATYRSKFGVRIYAIAHYGDPKVAANEGDPNAKLDYWVKAKAWKAIHIQFVYHVDEYNMRTAAGDALDKANYKKPLRDKFLNEFSRDYPEGSDATLIATDEGKLVVLVNGKKEGEYEDQELVDALWLSWLGEDTVVSKREKLVSIDIAKKAE